MKKIFVLALLLVLTSVFVQAQMYGESPLLAEQVAAGELPSVEERLPVNPKVIETSGTGIYGVR